MTLVESSELDTDAGFECESYDEPISDGAFKTKNRTSGEIERRVITDRGSESYFKSSVRMFTCLHGSFGGEGPERPVTLLVFEYRLHSLKPGHKFTFLHTKFVFQNAAKGAEASPHVIAYAPFHRPQVADETTVEVKETHGFGGNLGVSGGGPVTGGFEANIGREETHLQKHFQKGSAGIHYNEKTGLDDTVWWSLEQNQSQSLGIEAVFRVAVLLEREGSANFVGKFEMELEGSFTYRMEQLGESINPFRRRLAIDDPVNFSPTKSKRPGKVDGLVEELLGSLIVEDDGLSLPPNFRLDPFLPK